MKKSNSLAHTQAQQQISYSHLAIVRLLNASASAILCEECDNL
jgi:hypothetical protein